MQAFKSLLEKYQDFETSPASENIQRTIDRLHQIQTDYYFIVYNSIKIGAIRIVRKKNRRYRVSPLFILPEYQGKGIAKAMMQTVERMYEDGLVWELETILEEKIVGCMKN